MSSTIPFQSGIRPVAVAKAFFQAVTKHSDNIDDILPQEDGESRLSVYSLFSELFPEYVKGQSSSATGSTASTSHGLTRLQFNKIGYEMYVKEQSRRVPSPHAKPGNPGYGFRQARWRNTAEDIHDRILMFEILSSLGIPSERCEFIRQRVEDVRKAWDLERRPCRCAGPGRPRSARVTEANFFEEEKRARASALGLSPASRNQDEPLGSRYLDHDLSTKSQSTLNLPSIRESGMQASPSHLLLLHSLMCGSSMLSEPHAGGAARVNLPAILEVSAPLFPRGPPALSSPAAASALAAISAGAWGGAAAVSLAGREPLPQPPAWEPRAVDGTDQIRGPKRARDPEAADGAAEPRVNKASLAHLLS